MFYSVGDTLSIIDVTERIIDSRFPLANSAVELEITRE